MSDLETSIAEADAGSLGWLTPREIQLAIEKDRGIDGQVFSRQVLYQGPVDELPAKVGWTVAFTPTFRKSISKVDKSLQGRILSALSSLSEEPDVTVGDTVKPLEGDMKGLWRYRLGDFRLIYQPRKDSRQVVLLLFGPRGDAYKP